MTIDTFARMAHTMRKNWADFPVRQAKLGLKGEEKICRLEIQNWNPAGENPDPSMPNQQAGSESCAA